MRANSCDSSSSSDSINGGQKFKALYAKQLKKRQALQIKKAQKEKEKQKIIAVKQQEFLPTQSQKTIDLKPKIAKDKIEKIPFPVEIRWFIYEKPPLIDFNKLVPSPMNHLPIYKKKDQILDAIIKNQFILVTGETGCGKSTQVPRLIYEYLKAKGDKQSKIMCVQPRRLAVLNLNNILQSQMKDQDVIGYQIGMDAHIKSSNRIVFVTNGIFLQRMIHSSQVFEEYPFIVLDQVHQRDIDTDFILLTIKRLIRLHPKVRIVLMSATIDNQLFRYYFASDHVDKILTDQNFYKRVLRQLQKLQQQKKRKRDEVRMVDQNGQCQEDFQIDSDSRQEKKIYEEMSRTFEDSKYPCPTINVTEAGKFKKQFFYLDTLNKFLPKDVPNNKWGSAMFSDKYPSTNKELFQSVALIIQEVADRNKKNIQKSSILIFMPGLAQIEQLGEYITQFFTKQKIHKYFEIINVHSSILNQHITRKLHQKTGNRHKIIIATNIAESSITVLGVEFVIDFCLTKEVRFDIRSKMENLELVWTSKASCNQRAGRTGRVCNGYVFRLVQQKFYSILPKYSTPEIQRSSLDKLILKIKLMNEEEKNPTELKKTDNANGGDKKDNQQATKPKKKRLYPERQIFADPGQVLGSAIQPPNLKNIDTAIKALKFCGGLQQKNNELHLTNLGRLYVDIPIDITYCKLLVVSMLFDTFQDMLTLVSILSQSKNAIRRGTIQKNYDAYYKVVNNSFTCDFLGLLLLHQQAKEKGTIRLEILSEVQQMKKDIQRRIRKKYKQFPLLKRQKENNRNWKLSQFSSSNQDQNKYLLRFKITLACGFIENMLKVIHNTLDDKQQKRLKLMKKTNIKHNNTLCLLNSDDLKRDTNPQVDYHKKVMWKDRFKQNFTIKKIDFTLTYGLNYLHFQHQQDLQKFLFYKYMEENKKRNYYDERQSINRNFVSNYQLLKSLGEIDHMNPGRVVNWRGDTVYIDNYSLNRVVNLNQGASYKFLVTNSISRQSSRTSSKYSSLLPLNIKYFEGLTNLLFYPFVSLSTNKEISRYDYIILSKRKHKIPIKFCLDNIQIQQINQIRRKIRSYLQLKPCEKEEDVQAFQQQYKDFAKDIRSLLQRDRQQTMEDEKWQSLYLKDLFSREPDIKETYEIFKQQSIQKNQINIQKSESDRSFMNQINIFDLGTNYFSEKEELEQVPIKSRIHDYNFWKMKKLKEVLDIQKNVNDRQSYLACGQNSCGLKICKMTKVTPILEDVYRQILEYDEQNVKEVPFNEMDSHFCSCLMSNYIQYQFKVFGCLFNHPFAIKLDIQPRIKLQTFSNMMIIYADGSAQHIDFEKMDVKDWKRKHDEKLRKKNEITISTYCFVCDEILKSFKALENHISEQKHKDNVEDLTRTLPEEMRPKKTVKKQLQNYDSFY